MVEESWDEAFAGGGNPFREPFLKFWTPAGSAPALLLNATSVEHGYRVLFTPFRLAGEAFGEVGNVAEFTGLKDFHFDYQGAQFENVRQGDLPLSTVIGLSSRFPWVQPPGSVAIGDDTLRLVDGGYFENSGGETALDLLRALDWYRKKAAVTAPNDKHAAAIYLISIGSFGAYRSPAWQGLNELLSPVRAMLGTRSQRGNLSLERLFELYEDCSGNQECEQAEMFYFILNHEDFQLPLGFRLSRLTEAVIEAHSGVANREGFSGDILSPKRDSRVPGFISVDDESACSVMKVLSPTRGERAEGCGSAETP